MPANVPTWEGTLVNEPSICGDDAVLCQITLTTCYYRVVHCVFALCSVVVDELDISEVRHSRITRSRLTQFQAVRPALILLLTPLIFLPVPVVLGTKVCLSA